MLHTPTETSGLFRGILKLKSLCVGGQFASPPEPLDPAAFPGNVLHHTADFKFFTAGSFERALDVILQDQDIDLVFADADFGPLSEITMFITQVREIRPKLPVVIFTGAADDRMRYLMQAGVTWHFTKDAPELAALAEQIQQYVFSPVNWDEIFEQYASESVRPRIEPGLSYTDLEALNKNPEERYIIKRLFANSDVVQIFRMDEGFSGSRIYTVKPAHQLKRILKIEVADRLESVNEKQERLIQPRLNRQVGQIQGKIVRGQHFAGACYTLAGSNRQAVTLSQFLQDQNRVRKELIDKVLEQLRGSLDRLYAGSSDTELRYWAPLYARVLPTMLTLEDAVLVDPGETAADFAVSADEFTTLSAVPGNRTFDEINKAVREDEQPTVLLHGFEVAELDTEQGVLYLHDDLVARYPVSPLLKDKDQPLLRFKIRLRESQWDMLTHPVFRRGKRISIRGRVTDTQETILADNIASITGEPFDCESGVFELASGRFICPLENIRYLLWEIGREDMIVPLPQVSPVVHGDLNTSNILVEVGDDVPVWLIDFSDARPGHVYFDLAKLEVEFRTHVFYKLFSEMVSEGIWDVDTATKFVLLVEAMLKNATEDSFEAFISNLRDHKPDWYDSLYGQFPLYSENLLYFLYSLRKIAESHSPDRYRYHYPVAVFFQSIAALKFKGLTDDPWWPWAKRLALCAAVTAGKQAVEEIRRPHPSADQALDRLRQRSAFALITIGNGEDRKYMLQWNANWEMFNLIGGKIDNEKGDRDSFARAIQRELVEELGLRSPKDYRIVKELKPVQRQQFSRREYVFKEYEFRVFQIEILPRHPLTAEEYERFAQHLVSGRENVLVSRADIGRLRTVDNRPVSETTRIILQELGEIAAGEEHAMFATLDFQLESEEVIVSRGRAQLQARLLNPRFGNLVENVTVEVLPSPAYEVEPDSKFHHIDSLDAGQEMALDIWIQPKEKTARLTVRATFYDVRGNEYRQILESDVRFGWRSRALFHIDNPYVVGKPLTPASESLYVGREDVFAWIEENLLGKTQPHTLILYGQRRMGKTSTLYQLVGGRRGKTIREYPGYPIYPVYVDLQRLASCQTGEFFGRLAMEIERQLRRRGIELHMPDAWSLNGRSYHQFDLFLDQVDERLPANGLLVLILDELEQLQDSVERGRLSPDILPYLRSLMQHRPRLAFILAGTNQLVEDYWSIIFHVGISREITSLSRADIDTLIREPVSPMIQYDDLAVDQIWLATRGHPYFTQLICHRLISAVNLEASNKKVITIAEVRETINQTISEDDSHLQHLWNESTREEQLVLSALAGTYNLGEENVARAEVMARLRDTYADEEGISLALKQLEVRGLVRRRAVERQLQTSVPQPGGWQPTLVSKDHAYTISFDLLRRWLAQKRPLGSVIR